MTDHIYGKEQREFAKGVLAFLSGEPVFQGFACSTIMNSVQHVNYLWDTIQKTSRGLPHEDLAAALAFLKERRARFGDPVYELNFDLPLLTRLERDREATGASHSQILEAYHLLFLIAQESLDAHPQPAGAIQHT